MQSISSWKTFSADFKRAFRASQAARVQADSLANVRQQPGETLKAYLSRFANVAARARDADDSSKLMAMGTGILVGGGLWNEIQRKGVSSVNEFLNRAQGWINLEEAQASATGTSQVPDQPAGVGTEVVTATQTLHRITSSVEGKERGTARATSMTQRRISP